MAYSWLIFQFQLSVGYSESEGQCIINLMELLSG